MGYSRCATKDVHESKRWVAWRFLLRDASFPVKGNEAGLARFMCRLQTFLLGAGGAALRSGGGGLPSPV